MSPAEAHTQLSSLLHKGILDPDKLSDGDVLVMLNMLQRRYNSLAVRQAAS